MQFFNENESGLPPEEVRIEKLTAQPYPDRRRIFITIGVTPFRERPNLLLVARDDEDNIVSELDIISTMHNDMEFTLHLRTPGDPAGVYSLSAELFYESRNPPQDEKVIGFVVPKEENQ